MNAVLMEIGVAKKIGFTHERRNQQRQNFHLCASSNYTT